jgi:peroxiredoxin
MNVKRIMLLLIAAIIMGACVQKKPHYEITGTIQGADSVLLLLQKKTAGIITNLDSAMVIKGKFKIIGGAVEYPEIVLLVTKNKKAGKQFYLENSKITLTGRLDSLYGAKISGSKTQAESDSVSKVLEPYNINYSQIYMDRRIAEKSGDKMRVAESDRKLSEIDKEMTDVQKKFLRKNPASFVCPAILRSISYDMEADEIESFINSMDTNIAKTTVIKDLKERVVILRTVSAGKIAPDFVMNDVNGKPISLSSIIGTKLLLIDFWAAWCGPCRAENPNVVKVYKEFNKKGFNVIGVSLDRNKEDWIRAIADDKLSWIHVSDLQYWNNAAVKLYAVNAIPSNYLLDDKGMILARNLRGENLYNKVKEILSVKK